MPEITYIFIKEALGGTIIKLAVCEVLYLHSMGNYVKIICDWNKNYLIHTSLRKFLKGLPAARLCRIHQSHVINIDRILTVNGNMVTLENGLELKIGSNFRKGFLEMLVVQG